VDIQSITPAVVNDPHVANRLQSVASDLFPESQLDTQFSTMGSEDMSFFMQEVPGCFFFIGSANPEKGLDAAHHHPRFDFDEQALARGAALMASAAVELLG
jgi:amidohydrolase